MQNKTRKIISAFLTLAMILGLFWAMPMTASAADSMNWMKQPQSQTVVEGEIDAVFTVRGVASWVPIVLSPDNPNGDTNLKDVYGEWQYKNPGSSNWYRVDLEYGDVATINTNKNEPSLTFWAIEEDDGRQFRYHVWHGSNHFYSTAATLTVNPVTPAITQQPQSKTITMGNGNVQFTVNAVLFYAGINQPQLQYQWYVVPNTGGSATQITNNSTYSGATTNTLTIINPSPSMSGNGYYCKVTNIWKSSAKSTSINSSSAKLTVSPPVVPDVLPPNITKQPEDRSITAGQNTTFDIAVSGGGLQWQYRYPTGNTYTDWANIPSGSIYSTTIEQAGRLFLTNVPASYNNYQYRCVITNSAGTATSNTVTLTVYEMKDIPINIFPPILIGSPTIDGPAEMTLASGYAATSTGVYTITGIPDPEVTKTSGNSKITWNNNTKKLDIAAGLAAGTYPIVLTATNDKGNSSLTFTLTITAAPATEPPTEPATEPTTSPPTESATSPTSPTSPTEPTEPTNPPPPPPPFPFVDVLSTDWFYNNVKTAWEMGLVNGKTATTYEPTANLTYAEAVKLAACMHQYYKEGNVTLVIGTANWYDTYVAYAKTNHIISKDYEWNAYATRAGYMEIFANALPDDALWAQNSVANGSIPDVPMSHPQAAAIYKLYRAGIVQGVDNVTHACNPGSNIQRSEVAAIIDRMMNPTSRVTFTLG